MKDENEFQRWNQLVLNYNGPLIDSYKPLLTNKKNSYLLDLVLKIQAYDFGVLMQAKSDFKSDNNAYVPEKDEIREAEFKIKKFYRSSFDNEKSEKIKKLAFENALMHIKTEGVSLDDDFRKAYLKKEKYLELRRKASFSLKQEFFLDSSSVYNLVRFAFKEVVSLANRKTTLCFSNKEFSIKLADFIGFLERSIEIYYKKFIQDLGLKSKGDSLLDFRINVKQRYNTVCWSCGTSLFKTDNRHYCTRSENRVCYEARLKESREIGFPEVILRTKNKCENCGKHSSLDNIHRLRGIERQFCSKRCWEAFRKRVWRSGK